jgi:RNA polymerase sigma-70 factor (ECF subfamily)
LLVDIEQMAHADAAVVLDVAVGTIKSRLHRGRAMLRDRLYELAMERGWVPARSGRHE